MNNLPAKGREILSIILMTVCCYASYMGIAAFWLAFAMTKGAFGKPSIAITLIYTAASFLLCTLGVVTFKKSKKMWLTTADGTPTNRNLMYLFISGGALAFLIHIFLGNTLFG